jgi:hypothetical protein
MSEAWVGKVERVIAKMAYVEWYKMNHAKNGQRYLKHRSYRMPEDAEELVKCLGMKDRALAEVRAKEIMEGLRRAQVEID